MGGSGRGNRGNRVNLGHFVMSESKTFSKIDMEMSREYKIIFEEAPIGHIWDNLSLKKIMMEMVYNTLNKK